MKTPELSPHVRVEKKHSTKISHKPVFMFCFFFKETAIHGHFTCNPAKNNLWQESLSICKNKIKIKKKIESMLEYFSVNPERRVFRGQNSPDSTTHCISGHVLKLRFFSHVCFINHTTELSAALADF